jgi:hypothetical protein
MMSKGGCVLETGKVIRGVGKSADKASPFNLQVKKQAGRYTLLSL